MLFHVSLGKSDVSQGGEPLVGLVPPNSAQGPSPRPLGDLGDRAPWGALEVMCLVPGVLTAQRRAVVRGLALA